MQLLDVKSTSENVSLSLSLDKVLEEMQSSGWLDKHSIKHLNVTSDDDLALLSELYGISKVTEMVSGTHFRSYLMHYCGFQEFSH